MGRSHLEETNEFFGRCVIVLKTVMGSFSQKYTGSVEVSYDKVYQTYFAESLTTFAIFCQW